MYCWWTAQTEPSCSYFWSNAKLPPNVKPLIHGIMLLRMDAGLMNTWQPVWFLSTRSFSSYTIGHKSAQTIWYILYTSHCHSITDKSVYWNKKTNGHHKKYHQFNGQCLCAHGSCRDGWAGGECAKIGQLARVLSPFWSSWPLMCNYLLRVLVILLRIVHRHD